MIIELEEWLRKHDLLEEGDDPGLQSGLWVTDGVSYQKVQGVRAYNI
jgi:hypothetical protein